LVSVAGVLLLLCGAGLVLWWFVVSGLRATMQGVRKAEKERKTEGERHGIEKRVSDERGVS